MIDFTPVREKVMSVGQLTADFSRADLRRHTNDMIDAMLALIADCVDADVTFQPVDSDAYDVYADDETEISLVWKLGHVIVHTTASAEESASLAAELARGVPAQRRRSRYETPWQTITTIIQCQNRLEESRRMRLATLEIWPDEPHVDNVYTPWPAAGEVNAIGRFALGLWHDDDHLGQIANIVSQAKAARS
ncbi:MAG: DinB family protein [Chloroflexi bacterium]|nr:DinB family protein [Chloroflexota bacterium]